MGRAHSSRSPVIKSTVGWHIKKEKLIFLLNKPSNSIFDAGIVKYMH